MTEPAREDDSRATAHSELEGILRDADMLRRRASTDAIDDEAREGELHPRLGVVQGRGPRPARDAVRFDTFDVKVDDPGEFKLRTFRLSARAGVAIGLGALAAYLWLTAPGGMEGFKPVPLPASYLDASARWAMVLTSERIDQFAAERLRLPQGLDELGPAPSDLITYERLSDTEYRLQAPGRNSALTLGPTTSRELFVDGSLDILRLGPDKAP